MITFEQALALPQANYLTFAQTTIRHYDLIGAGMGVVVVANGTSIMPFPYTGGFAPCSCKVLINPLTGVRVLTHASEYLDEVLLGMVSLARDSEDMPLRLHVLGACYGKEGSYARTDWEREMRSLIGTINTIANLELATFDTGHKPHPTTVALWVDENGKEHLVRGGVDVTSLEETDFMSDFYIDFEGPEHRPDGPIEIAEAPEDFKPTSQTPFLLGWDGRLSENQDWDKNPAAKLAYEEKMQVKRTR